MTTSTNNPTTDVTTIDTDSKGTDTDPSIAEIDKWKSLARKHEQQAKANADAAVRLAQLEESQKSEADRVADRLSKAEERVANAERRALRREVAIEFGLNKDASALLDDLTDESAIRKHAEYLSKVASDRKKNGNVVPNEGRTTTPPAGDEMREFTRNLFHRDG